VLSLSLLYFSYHAWNSSGYIVYIISYLLLVSSFLHGDEDVAFLDVGRWSRVCGHTHSRSRDHVVSRESHMYIGSGLGYHDAITTLSQPSL
jgi:hypothetical protein